MKRQYLSKAPDPVEWVSSVIPNVYYHCPTVAAVDEHISELREVCGIQSNWKEALKITARFDINLLLDRRLFLAWPLLDTAARAS